MSSPADTCSRLASASLVACPWELLPPHHQHPGLRSVLLHNSALPLDCPADVLHPSDLPSDWTHTSALLLVCPTNICLLFFSPMFVLLSMFLLCSQWTLIAFWIILCWTFNWTPQPLIVNYFCVDPPASFTTSSKLLKLPFVLSTFPCALSA